MNEINSKQHSCEETNGKAVSSRHVSTSAPRLSLLLFVLAIGVHAGTYFLFGLRGVFLVWWGWILGGLMAIVAFSLMLEEVVRSLKTRNSKAIGFRLTTLLLMIAVAFLYLKCGMVFTAMHCGLIKRVESEVDIAALQTWAEAQTENIDKIDWEKLSLPIQQPKQPSLDHPYRVRVGDLKNGNPCVCIQKNFGGGFWDFGIAIGPHNMSAPSDPETRYHLWRKGVYTWL